MQIILREDVEHLGRRGDVVKVADGYARNYLIPKSLGYRFSEGMRKQVETESRAKKSRETRERKDAETLALQLREVAVVRFTRRAGDSGTLFGSVTSSDIAEALAGMGYTIDRRQVRIDEPIKRTGTHRIPVHVHKDISIELAIEVEPEGGEAGS